MDNQISGKQIRDGSIILNTKIIATEDYKFVTATGSSIFLLSDKSVSDIENATGSVLVNRNYVDSVIASNGLTVMDEGATISTNVVGLNFIGATVLTEESTLYSRFINVFIPTPNYAADFNTDNTGISTNGTNAYVISNLNSLAASNRANRNRPYTGQSSLNPSASSNVDSIRWISSANIVYYSSYFTIDHPTNNILSLQVIKGGDNTILSSSTCSLSSNLTYSQGVTNSIIQEFKVSGITSEINRWKCYFTASINMQNGYSSSGATGGMQFYVNIVNKRATQTFTYSKASTNSSNNSPNIWLDRELVTTSVGTPTISQASFSTKSLSGVNYITSGSTFNVNISSINNINNGSYPNTFMELDLSQYLMGTININSSMLTGWTNSFSNSNASLSATYTLGSNNTSTVNSIAIIRTRYIDWDTGSYVNGTSNSILIDTLSAVPSRIFDDFTTETNGSYPRLQSDLATSWNSSTLLGAIDSGNGLQLSQSRLIYPTINYTGYIPTNTANYTSLTGVRVWRRKFYTGSDATTYGNGIFTFGDTNITEAMLTSSDLIVEIGDGTNWFTLNNSYTSGSLSNGSGARINSSNSNLTNGTKTLSFTLGTLNLNTLYIRISYSATVTGKSIYIGSITLNW